MEAQLRLQAADLAARMINLAVVQAYALGSPVGSVQAITGQLLARFVKRPFSNTHSMEIVEGIRADMFGDINTRPCLTELIL